MESSSLTLIFGGILVAGLTYIFISLFFGGLEADIDADFDADLDLDGSVDVEGGDSEAVGISLNVIAAFCVGVGTVGVIGGINNWPLLMTLLVSVLFGLLLGRLFQMMMRFVLRQQSNNVLRKNQLVGAHARMTVSTPAGSLGEAIIEEPVRLKYAVKHLSDAPLQKGDIVEVIKVEAGRLYVQKLD